MTRHACAARWLRGVIAGLMLFGLLGADCTVVLPTPTPTVIVQLDNRTGFDVDPGLFASTNPDVAFSVLTQDENYQPFDPLLGPDETGINAAELEYDCEDFGAITSYLAFLYLTDEEVVESADSPVVRYGEDFVCGDIITFVYEVDEDDFFRTSVRINGEWVDQDQLD